YDELSKAKTFVDLATVAINIIFRIPEKVEMVSGPISTGGVGNIHGNRRVFEGVIEILILEQDLNIFSQMPFEDKMVELYLEWHKRNPAEKYCLPILYEFYDRLFFTGRISRLNFIHDWQSSFGAKWEHDNCDRWGIRRNFLSKELSERALNGHATAALVQK
ncbi:MAG: hypothetical protein KGJ35_03280, partial [Patescibacteria group bacterium]|nr:hypothetical protein [Patescibacteria group bacterium]